MKDTILQTEPMLRLAAFVAVLGAMIVWEFVAPRRRQEIPRLVRWSNNLALVALDTAILRLVFPLLAVGFAMFVQERGWGLLNLLALPGWLAVAIAFVLLDLAIWAQHVAFHHVPLFWRFHRMHHSDTHFDATTGVRFHPGEIVVSMLYKLALIAALGAPPLAVLLFEIVLNATSMITHGNVTLGRADRPVRWILVTPDMHRVHHSAIREETDSNFGFNLSAWDRLFGTYREDPAQGHAGMVIGLERFREPRDAWLDRMLWQPFAGGSGRERIELAQWKEAGSEEPASRGD